MSEDKAVRLAEIAEEIQGCPKCPLSRTRTHTVPGAGSPEAEILFVGEGPGQNEDIQGLPFVGRSGEYLNYLLSLIQLERRTVFITNVVKCRPPGNRDPEPDEITACKDYLDRQIAVIDPVVIVTLGRFSMARYFPNEKISAIHGQPKYDGGRAYYPLFHPAAALRNPALRRDMENDVKRLPSLVAEMKARRAAGVPVPPGDTGTEGGTPAPEPGAEQQKPDAGPPRQLGLF